MSSGRGCAHETLWNVLTAEYAEHADDAADAVNRFIVSAYFVVSNRSTHRSTS